VKQEAIVHGKPVLPVDDVLSTTTQIGLGLFPFAYAAIGPC
jgi:hypothetical protein